MIHWRGILDLIGLPKGEDGKRRRVQLQRGLQLENQVLELLRRVTRQRVGADRFALAGDRTIGSRPFESCEVDEPLVITLEIRSQKIRELASRFRRADRIVMGVPMWNFSFPYKLKQLIDLSCQRNMLFTFDGKCYGPSLDIEKAFVAFVRGQSDEAGFETVPQPGFQYLSGYVEFWLRFIGVREVVTLALEHTWDGRAVDMIDASKKKATELAKQF